LTPAGLVLAAGEGSRLGRPKALVTFDGELLVDRAVRVAREGGCDPVVVVLGAAADEVVHAASLDDAVVVVNDGWPEGIGSSLRCGLSAMADQQASAAVVLLVDQPGIGAEAVRRLIAGWRDGAVAVTATYDGAMRNPVLLDASIWAEVSASARGDVGARAWLREHASEVVAVACDDLGSDDDIDTVADLQRLTGQTQLEDDR
jgi:CTP:molybdopterin cytidylyltransferase MocA